MAQSVDETIRGLRIIVSGLIAGLGFFTIVIAFGVGPLSRTPDPFLSRALPIGLGLFAVAAAAAYTVVRRKILNDLRARASAMRQVQDPSPLALDEYRRFVVAGGGLIEGPGFFAGIIYLLTGQPVALAAIGLAIALLATVHFPSAEKLRAFAEEAARD